MKISLLHNKLNPAIWDLDSEQKYTINQNLRKKLLKLAKGFYKQSELTASIKDVILTGSNANYNWTQFSDLDLHIVIDYKDINDDTELVRKVCNGIKTRWNTEHQIKLNGYNVEVYIQDENEPHVASGIYSLLNDKWIKEPKLQNIVIDKETLKSKYYDFVSRIKEVQKSKDEAKAKKLFDDILRMRKTGLQKEGEYSIENLTFKLLRSMEWIKTLKDLVNSLYDKNIVTELIFYEKNLKKMKNIY